MSPYISDFEFYCSKFSVYFVQGEVKNDQDTPFYDIMLRADWTNKNTGASSFITFFTTLSATTNFTTTPFFQYIPQRCDGDQWDFAIRVESYKVDTERVFVPITSTAIYGDPIWQEAAITNTYDIPLYNVQFAAWKQHGNYQGYASPHCEWANCATLQPGQFITASLFAAYFCCADRIAAIGMRQEITLTSNNQPITLSR